MRVLLVEDNVALAAATQMGLHELKHTVDVVHRAEGALRVLADFEFDVVVVDIGLPTMSGLSLLQALRKSGQDVAVILLTARDGILDRVEGLNAGADDYLVKPFDLFELDARIRAVTRRRTGHDADVWLFGKLSLNVHTREVCLAGAPVSLSRKEFEVLRILLEAQGGVVANSVLESKLYDFSQEIESNCIQVYVSNLRKKLGKEVIKTWVRIGYSMGDKP